MQEVFLQMYCDTHTKFDRTWVRITPSVSSLNDLSCEFRNVVDEIDFIYPRVDVEPGTSETMQDMMDSWSMGVHKCTRLVIQIPYFACFVTT